MTGTEERERKMVTQEDYIKAIRRIDRYHEKVGADMRIVEAYVDALEDANKQWLDLIERSGLGFVIDQTTGQKLLMRKKLTLVMFD